MGRISQFPYVYGAGNRVNRVILFKETHNKVSAEIYAVNGKENPICISTVKCDQIFVDSTSAMKKKALLERNRNNWEALQEINFPGEEPIDSLNIKEQESILQNLGAKGSWSITIQNHVGKDPRFEKVVQLHIFKK